MHACAGSVLLPQLGSHHVHAGETSSGIRNVPSLVPFPFLPAHGHPGGNSNCSLFWGVPPLSLPLRTHGRWCGWERMVASPTEAALATVCVWAGRELLCLGTAGSIAKLLSEKDQRTVANENLPEWNLRNIKRWPQGGCTCPAWNKVTRIGNTPLAKSFRKELSKEPWRAPRRWQWPSLGQKRNPAAACCLPLSNTRQLMLLQEIGGRLTKGLLRSGLCGLAKRSCNSHPVWLFLPQTSPVICFAFQIRLTPSKIRNLLETWSLPEPVVSTSLGGFCTVLGVGRVQGWKGSRSLHWEGDRKTTDGAQHSSLGWANLSSARYC